MLSYGLGMPGAVGLVFCAALGCSTAPPPSVAPVAKPALAPPARAPVALQKKYTGQAQPSLVVENGFPIAEHVFIDWVHVAVLPSAASRRFALQPGTHTLTCADSADPDDRPATITESFEAGYAYAYVLHASR